LGLVGATVSAEAEAEAEASQVSLDRSAVDPDFWLLRSASLAHLVLLTKGNGDWARFTGYVEAMRLLKEFFIVKAIGWILFDRSRKRIDLVRDWVAPRTQQMSGVTSAKV
jgi:3-methyladenine DNA glycosylase AlkD